MTNNAKYEKDLKRMQQRLDILAPIIKDAHDSCLSMCKFLMATSITLHGGAIGIILTNFYSTASITLGYFLIGIMLSFAMAVLFIVMDHFQLCEYYKSVSCKKFDYECTFKAIKKAKCWTYALIYSVSIASIFLFIHGVDVSFRNSVLITKI